MKRKMTSIILMVFVATLAFAGGSKEGKKAEAMNPTIVEIASNDERFSTLVTALGAADLVDTLNGEGPFTVFAPTNDAFAALPEGALEGLLADTAALTEVLLYHVASGRLMASDVVTLSELLVDESRISPIVGQLPDDPGDGWVAVRAPADDRGRLAFFVVDGGGLAPLAAGAAVAGLMFDAWLDQIPGRDLVTGAALHFDAPSSRPPQAMLLVVPPEGEEWSFDLVVDSLMETLEAAKLRAVDPDILLAHGHQFPAVFPPGAISAGAQPETTDG